MEFSITDIEQLCEIDRNRLYQWMRAGYIEPTIQKASGHGTKNKWSFSDLIKIQVFKRMLESGWSREATSKITNAPKLYCSFGLPVETETVEDLEGRLVSIPVGGHIKRHESAKEQMQAVFDNGESFYTCLVYMRFKDNYESLVHLCSTISPLWGPMRELIGEVRAFFEDEKARFIGEDPVEMYYFDYTPITIDMREKTLG